VCGWRKGGFLLPHPFTRVPPVSGLGLLTQVLVIWTGINDASLSMPRLITGEVEEGRTVDEVEVEQSRKGKLQHK